MSTERDAFSDIDLLQKSVVELSDNQNEIAKEFNALKKELEDQKMMFKSFAMAILKNIDKDISDKVFEEYQKNKFKKQVN